MRRLRTLIQKLNTPKVEALLVLLVAIILLRIPNLIEPYWYGDEAIYLTLGNALRHGERLYADIIDHKTPLIYYFAMVPNQFSFRVLLMGWMLTTTVLFYHIAFHFFNKLWPTIIASVVFVLFTTLPWIEGNIPNGELFVMGFILAGLSILLQTKTVSHWLAGKPVTQLSFISLESLKLATAGIFISLGILTKVPAIFDLAALLSLGWFGLTHTLWQTKFARASSFVLPFAKHITILMTSVIVAIALSVVYFVARGSGSDYLAYGLLYNFRYAGSWNPEFSHPLIAFFFTLKGKVLILAGLGLLFSILSKWMTPKKIFPLFWLVLSLIAATLSNRPYPHYLLQVIPPLALLAGYLVAEILTARERGQYLPLLPHLGLGVGCLSLVLATWQILGFYNYPALAYYQHFGKLLTRQISYQSYAQSFNFAIADNEKVISILHDSPHPYLFIWGTNPILYAQSQKVPATRFTVAFHIKDFQAYESTLAEIKNKDPEYIVVMNDDQNTFPQLTEYLLAKYVPNSSFTHMVLWKKF